MMPTKFTFQTLAILVSYCAMPVAGVLAETGTAFQRGHVFVSLTEAESCDFGGREWIVEIDPQTGDWSVFADSDDGICGVSGLRFTPDGSRLLAVNFGHYIEGLDGGWVQSFLPDGTSEIVLDASGGLAAPFGSNALAFDRNGDLLLLSGDTRLILGFPAEGGPATVVADLQDGVSFRGGLEFSHIQHLFFGGWQNIAQIPFAGESSVFEDVGGSGIAIDRFDNIYVARATYVVRMTNLQVDQEEVLADGFFGWNTVSVSADGSTVYVVDAIPTVFGVNTTTLETHVVADLGSLSWQFLTPVGITVFAPIVLGDVDANGSVNLSDIPIFVACFSGPSVAPVLPTCYPADIDFDLTVDLLDFAIIQRE